eukprot:7153398-Prymnesium_polylepis.5
MVCAVPLVRFVIREDALAQHGHGRHQRDRVVHKKAGDARPHVGLQLRQPAVAHGLRKPLRRAARRKPVPLR